MTEVLDQLSLYDQAFVDWLKTCPLRTIGDKLLVVFASPERAFGHAKELLGDAAANAQDISNLPLPILSVERGDITFDNRRFHGPKTLLRRMAYATGGGTVKQAVFPSPASWIYRVSLWAKYRTTLNQWAVWRRLQFPSNERNLEIDFSPVDETWGSKIIPIFDEGLTDASELEAEDGSERILRSVQSIRLDGWVFGPMEHVKTVLRVITELREPPHGVDIAPKDVSSEDVVNHPENYPLLGTVTVSE